MGIKILSLDDIWSWMCKFHPRLIKSAEINEENKSLERSRHLKVIQEPGLKIYDKNCVYRPELKSKCFLISKFWEELNTEKTESKPVLSISNSLPKIIPNHQLAKGVKSSLSLKRVDSVKVVNKVKEGYCERCRIKFKDVKKHLESQHHLALANDVACYPGIDEFFKEFPVFSEFSKTRMKKQVTLQRLANKRLIKKMSRNDFKKECIKTELSSPPIEEDDQIKGVPNFSGIVESNNKSEMITMVSADPAVVKNIIDFRESTKEKKEKANLSHSQDLNILSVDSIGAIGHLLKEDANTVQNVETPADPLNIESSNADSRLKSPDMTIPGIETVDMATVNCKLDNKVFNVNTPVFMNITDTLGINETRDSVEPMETEIVYGITDVAEEEELTNRSMSLFDKEIMLTGFMVDLKNQAVVNSAGHATQRRQSLSILVNKILYSKLHHTTKEHAEQIEELRTNCADLHMEPVLVANRAHRSFQCYHVPIAISLLKPIEFACPVDIVPQDSNKAICTIFSHSVVMKHANVNQPLFHAVTEMVTPHVPNICYDIPQETEPVCLVMAANDRCFHAAQVTSVNHQSQAFLPCQLSSIEAVTVHKAVMPISRKRKLFSASNRHVTRKEPPEVVYQEFHQWSSDDDDDDEDNSFSEHPILDSSVGSSIERPSQIYFNFTTELTPENHSRAPLSPVISNSKYHVFSPYLLRSIGKSTNKDDVSPIFDFSPDRYQNNLYDFEITSPCINPVDDVLLSPSKFMSPETPPAFKFTKYSSSCESINVSPEDQIVDLRRIIDSDQNQNSMFAVLTNRKPVEKRKVFCRIDHIVQKHFQNQYHLNLCSLDKPFQMGRCTNQERYNNTNYISQKRPICELDSSGSIDESLSTNSSIQPPKRKKARKSLKLSRCRKQSDDKYFRPNVSNYHQIIQPNCHNR